jgi:hypothetical protein
MYLCILSRVCFTRTEPQRARLTATAVLLVFFKVITQSTASVFMSISTLLVYTYARWQSNEHFVFLYVALTFVEMHRAHLSLLVRVDLTVT